MRRTLAGCALLLLAFATAQAQTVRVCLWSQHPPRSLTLSAAPSLEIRKYSGCASLKGKVFMLAARNSQVEFSGKHINRILVRGQYAIKVDDRSVRLSSPLEVTARGNELNVTALLPLEEYVTGVVAGEAGGITSPETLKAIAVAARTYAVHFAKRHAAQGFDFCDSTHCQDLRLSTVDERTRNAVDATQGELLWHDGATIAAYYHKDCGGTTERASEDLSQRGRLLPYLPQQEDSWCRRHGSEQWHVGVSKSELARALALDGIRAPRNLHSVSVMARSPSGRVQRLKLAGEFTNTVDEDVFYTAIGRNFGWNKIRSALYEIEDRGDSVEFRGRGSGHGVGLCQTGAVVMGSEGHTYREILAFYYPHTEVEITPHGLRWSELSGERVDLYSTHPETERNLVALSERMLREGEERSGLRFDRRIAIRVYPTVASFRDATGEPGWVAASTRGSTIRLQPGNILKKTRSLDSVLRHEMLHLVVESNARVSTPLWFREGLVLWLNHDAAVRPVALVSDDTIERMLRAPRNQQELRRAYEMAQARIAILASQYGKPTVLSWLVRGLPTNLKQK